MIDVLIVIFTTAMHGGFEMALRKSSVYETHLLHR